MALANPRRHRGTSLLMAARRPAEFWLTDLGGNIAHMALEGVTSLGAMTVKTKGCVITWGP